MTPTDVLDEGSKRKPCWDQANSVAVVLANGQAWYVPKPWLEIRPVFRNGTAVANYPVFTYGPELEGLIEAIAETDDFWQQLCFVATLGSLLLRHQYELVDADLDQILAYRQNDPKSAEWVERVIEVATGRSGPKVGRAGDD